jgi:hypothetical protein
VSEFLKHDVGQLLLKPKRAWWGVGELSEDEREFLVSLVGVCPEWLMHDGAWRAIDWDSFEVVQLEDSTTLSDVCMHFSD